MSAKSVIAGLDKAVDEFSRNNRLINEPLTIGRAHAFVMQHRQNTRQRNSVLKLRVATNCPVWDVKIGILEACTEELIADNEFYKGEAHWKVLEDLGIKAGLTRAKIRNAPTLRSTKMCWLAWEALMSNTHWLRGLVANTCAERANIPGYGTGLVKKRGWFGSEHAKWKKLFGMSDEDLVFFGYHGEADVVHSEHGWKNVAKYATELHMEDAAIEACRDNLMVWDHYLNGIADWGDELDRKAGRAT
ncbi:MAG: iron-containing redox enzyme family protein [Rhodospirillaceae bacterium]